MILAYIPVSSLDYTSPDVADASPSVTTIPKAATLTSLNVADGAYIYFRWSGADVSVQVLVMSLD